MLKSFYRNVRPWGWWDPDLSESAAPMTPSSRRIATSGGTCSTSPSRLVWQTSLVTGPIYLAIQHWTEMWISGAVFAITSVILKFTWYDRLGPGEMYLEEPAPARAAVAGDHA